MRILKKIFNKGETKKPNLFAEPGKFNKSWETVEEWLSSNIDFSKYKNNLEDPESENGVMNKTFVNSFRKDDTNVFVFNKQKEH